jgi:SAM-dependent methyltransferase
MTSRAADSNASGLGGAQEEYWNGDVGRLWANEHARFDRVLAGLTHELLARALPQPGESVIDIGCGAGGLALALARAVGPFGRVTALDISAPMLATARARDAAERDATRAAIDWRLADASREPLEPRHDLLASRFGTMFFEAPIAAFSHLLQALKPGGRLAMLCWRPLEENMWMTLPRDAIRSLAGTPEPTRADAPGPYAFADAARVRDILAQAGFDRVAHHPIDTLLQTGTTGPDGSALTHAVDMAMKIGPAAALVRERGDGIREKVRAAITEALAPHVEGDAVRLGAACWIYEARRPG